MNAAPGWYTSSEPPKPRTALGAMAGGAGALAQGAQATAEARSKDPYRTPENKAKDQVNATKAGIVSSLLGYFAGQPQAEFQTRQDAALKDAQMQKLASDRFNAGGNTALGLLNYDDRVRQHNAALAAAEAKAQLAAENDDAGSQRSARAREAARAAGLQVPDTMSATDVTRMRTALMQSHHEDFQAGQYDIKHGNEVNDTLSKEERAQLARVQQEQREARERDSQFAIPGLVPISGRAPDPKSVNDAKILKGDTEEMAKGARELKEIQKQVQDANLMAGALGGYKYTKFATPQAQQALIQKAALIQAKMSTAARRLDMMGVPQQFEIDIQNSLNPRAGTLDGLFTGNASWDAIDSYYAAHGRERLLNLGYAYEGSPEAANAKTPELDRPAEGQVTRYAKPAQRSAKTGAVVPAYGQVGQGATGNASAPGPAPAPMSGAGIKGTAKDAIGVFQIADGSSPYYLTQAQYNMMVQKYGADRVKRLR